jgi:ribosome-binding protein aMBF1 (putative translation factor)
MAHNLTGNTVFAANPLQELTAESGRLGDVWKGQLMHKREDPSNEAVRKLKYILFWDIAQLRGRTSILKSIHSTDHRRFCDLIRQLREEKGITQLGLAEKLDQPQSFVSKFETGERRLDVLELRSVCLALDVPLKRFVSLLEEELR